MPRSHTPAPAEAATAGPASRTHTTQGTRRHAGSTDQFGCTRPRLPWPWSTRASPGVTVPHGCVTRGLRGPARTANRGGTAARRPRAQPWNRANRARGMIRGERGGSGGTGKPPLVPVRFWGHRVPGYAGCIRVTERGHISGKAHTRTRGCIAPAGVARSGDGPGEGRGGVWPREALTAARGGGTGHDWGP
jgi:hypothetical protein